jgi:sugar phosphate isomerase/epimerase
MQMPHLSVSLAGLDPRADRPWGSDARSGIRWLSASGVRRVQLNGAASGTRPRDLDRSARRDLAATLRREELGFTGLDLWVPSEHFIEPTRSDRALGAALSAAEMCAEIGALLGERSPCLSVALPADCPRDVTDALSAAAESSGILIADHAWPWDRARLAGDGPIGVGLDPVAPIIGGEDPALVAARAGSRLFSARLSDVSSSGGGGGAGRAPAGGPGSRLDVLTYRAALVTIGYERDVVVDLRGLTDPAAGLAQAMESWEQTLPS